MRIAFFSDNSYPELSGIADTILITGRELKKRGHEIVYVGPHYSPTDYAVAGRTYPKTPADDQVDGMRFVRLPSVPLPFSPTGQSRFAFPLGASYSHLHAFKPDLIHTNSPYGVGWEARSAAKRFNIPLIGSNHTAIEDFLPLQSIARRYDARYYNHCSFVSAPYEKLLTRMREVGFRNRSRAVSNPVRLDVFTPVSAGEKTAAKRALGLTGPVLLTSGRLAVEKNVHLALRGLALLVPNFPTCTLIMTGHGSEEARLRSLATTLGIEKNVRFTGFIEKEQLVQVYAAADVFAFMSTSDSQSIALMQAYASGIPAVCARARGLPDYTSPEVGFLVEPGDHQALAEKLKLLLDDDALRERMGAAAHAFVKKLAPEKIADEWEQIYASAIAEHSRS